MSNLATVTNINQGKKEMPSKNGYVKIWRDIRNVPFWKSDLEAKSIWIELIMSAQHSYKMQDTHGLKVHLNAGQLLVTRAELIEMSGVDNDSKIERCLKKFVKLEQISRVSLKHKGKFVGQLITILNWEKWQKSEQLTEQSIEQPRTAEIKALSGYTEQSIEQPTEQHSNNVSNKKDLVSKDTCQNSGEFSPAEVQKIPYQEIVELFATCLPALPQPKKLTDARRKAIKARHTNDMKSKVENWERYFNYIRENCSWMISGEYNINFDYVIKQSNFQNILEGAKNDRG